MHGQSPIQDPDLKFEGEAIVNKALMGGGGMGWDHLKSEAETLYIANRFLTELKEESVVKEKRSPFPPPPPPTR